jgi:hypothetical protein
MGGYGSGRNSGRPNIDQGLKLDLRSLRRREMFIPDGMERHTSVQWTYTYTEEHVATIGLAYCAGASGGSLRLTYTSTPYGQEPQKINETFQLIRFPQPFGGCRWYIVCPATFRYCQCIYLPPGAPHFRSRHGFKVRLMYNSQKLDRSSRVMESARKLAAKVLRIGPPNWRQEHKDWDFPPKPPWMRWKTYNRYYASWEQYERLSNAYLEQWALKLGGLKK